jgi:hypothetical protein
MGARAVLFPVWSLAIYGRFSCSPVVRTAVPLFVSPASPSPLLWAFSCARASLIRTASGLTGCSIRRLPPHGGGHGVLVLPRRLAGGHPRPARPGPEAIPGASAVRTTPASDPWVSREPLAATPPGSQTQSRELLRGDWRTSGPSMSAPPGTWCPDIGGEGLDARACPRVAAPIGPLLSWENRSGPVPGRVTALVVMRRRRRERTPRKLGGPQRDMGAMLLDTRGMSMNH